MMSLNGIFSLFCGIMFLMPGACTTERKEAALTSVSERATMLSETAVLATVGSQKTSGPGDAEGITAFFSAYGRSAACLIRHDGGLRVLFRGRTGPLVQAVDRVVLSDDGSRIAYSAMLDGKWRMFVDGSEGAPSDEVGTPSFSPDGRHLSYAAKIANEWHLVLDGGIQAQAAAHIGSQFFSRDSHKMVYSVKKRGASPTQLIVSDLSLQELFVRENCGEAIVLNRDRTRIAAVSGSGRQQRVIQMNIDDPESFSEGALFDAVSHLVFGDDGISVAYIGVRNDHRYLVVNERMDLLPEGSMPWPPAVRAHKKGAGILISAAGGFFLYQTYAPNRAAMHNYEEAADLAYDRDGEKHVFAARRGGEWFIVVNGKEGPAFDRVVTPIFSPDGKNVVYRARQNGRRFVVIADAVGRTIERHPGHEQVFPVAFTVDGRSIAYGVLDKEKLIWRVEKLP